MRENILVGEEAVPRRFFRLDLKQLRQVIAAVAAVWARSRCPRRGRIVEVNLIEEAKDDDPSVAHRPGQAGGN